MLRFVLAGLLFSLACTLSATMALRLELEELEQASALIVVAKVEVKVARWCAGNAGIWTHHEIAVSETLKGEHIARREFVTRGGVVGERGQHVAGAGNFAPGEEYVLFLWRDDDGRYQLTGMVQGAFRVSRVDGVLRARNSLAGLTILDPTTLKPVKRPPHDYTLAELRKRLRMEGSE